MSSRFTIADVARRAGVSIATVSRVLNQTATVAPATAERVRASVAELNYTPHTAARALAGKKTNTVGLILPAISGAFFPPMLRGVERSVRENGFDLLIYSTQPRRGEPIHHPLGEHNTDGLIIFTNCLDDSELSRLNDLSFPMILLHRTTPAGMAIPSVVFENKAGARRLVEHLITVHGRHQIAFLRGPANNEDSYWREEGYGEALDAHDIAYDPARVAVANFDEADAQTAVNRWLVDGLPIDAIFAGDDDAALGALNALRQAGKRVPQDVAVVGFDDVPFARHTVPPLTTVYAPIEEAGYTAAAHLIECIRSTPVEPFTMLPTALVVRQSCGCL
jgi:LacI family transcriptional regulator